MAVHAADLEDFVAEALARAYGCGGWRAVERGESFLFHIARNLVFDAARRRGVVQFDPIAEAGDIALVDEQPSPETIASDRQRLAILKAAIMRLPPSYRDIVLLRRVEALSTVEAARRVGLSISAVEKRLALALVILKDALVAADGTAPAKNEQPGDARVRAARIRRQYAALPDASRRSHRGHPDPSVWRNRPEFAGLSAPQTKMRKAQNTGTEI